MAKNCPHCMTELPDDAPFCYECGKPQPSSAPEQKTMPRWAALLVFALVALCFLSLYRMMQPKTYMGTHELEYTSKKEGTYHLTLSFGSIDEACETLLHTDGTPLTSYLYVTDENGENAIETFQPRVRKVKVTALPIAGATIAELSESGHDDNAWSCVAYNDSTAGSNILRWNLTLENGDTLILSHQVAYSE